MIEGLVDWVGPDLSVYSLRNPYTFFSAQTCGSSRPNLDPLAVNPAENRPQAP
jgi:hypothetical protein